MNSRRIIVASIFVAVLVGILIFLRNHRESWVPDRSVAQPAMSQSIPPRSAPTPPLSVGDVAKQMPGGPYEHNDPRWAERRRMREIDPKYEWKTPISFYGKVIDDNGAPISDA